MIYFDTSYLTKCYINEEGSDAVRELARRSEHIACCEFGRCELYAAIHRNLRDRKIDRHYADTAVAQLRQDDADGVWEWLPVNHDLLAAVNLLFTTLPAEVYLRTGDALHICCARSHQIAHLYTHDRHMLAAAPLLGVPAADIL